MMRSATENPFEELLKRQKCLVLDGGLATALEARGQDLDDDLWSARVLLEAPQVIQQVHLDYLRAGADCITTSSYQASIVGFRRRGLGEAQSAELLRRSVALAIAARAAFWREPENRAQRLRPLVAASVGPYGAFLADGSEYTGRYGVDPEELYAFHRTRWQLLADTGADLLACETIPSHDEARVLLRLLRETPGRWAWFSFSCRDGAHLSDGRPLSEVVQRCDAEARVAAIGVNCTAPRFMASLIAEVRAATKKPVIVYPNSGETYDRERRSWRATSAETQWQAAAREWARLGARVIGGCCRVGPEEIAEIRAGVRDGVPDT